jgi:hypothetical protein
MRAFTRDALEAMKLRAGGMEFASEMIVRAIAAKMKITEIPIPYYPRMGESKLRTFRDGWRHLRFLLLEGPTLLFLIPGLVMMLVGIGALAALTPGRLQIGALSFDFHYMVVASLLAILGWQVLSLGLSAKLFFLSQGLHLPDRFTARFIRSFSLEKILAGSGVTALAGLGLLIWVLASWIQQGFGFDDEIMLRPAIFGMTLLVLGIGSGFSAFFMSLLMLQGPAAKGYVSGN